LPSKIWHIFHFMDFDDIVSSLPTDALTEISDLPYPHLASGKVREIFDLGENLLIVATDRLSAFDVVLPDPIPGKGAILTQMSLYWFQETSELIANHLLPDQERILKDDLNLPDDIAVRSMAVRRLRPLPVECVVRGYLAGSGWNSYQESGQICGHEFPSGFEESERLPHPIFTPTTKAAEGHDQPITESECAKILGRELFDEVRRISLELYAFGYERSRAAGMILADTKFEFGLDEQNQLYLIDEVLTPDSSRFWPSDEYEPGRSQPSFDKQFVRDFLLKEKWDRNPPAPRLPAEVITETRKRYLQALTNLLRGH